MPIAGVETARGIEDDLALTAIRETAAAYPPLYIARYFKDDEGKPPVLKSFHLELIDAICNPEVRRVLVKLPASHGKSTIARWCETYLMDTNRDIRIMHIMNNATDAELHLGAIERMFEDHSSLLSRERGPFKGDAWKTTDFNVSGRKINDPWPTFAAFGTGSNVLGHRADLIVCDDILDLDNSGPNVTDRTRGQVRDWFFQAVMKVAEPRGKIVVIGTAMDFRDLYEELEANPAHGFKVIKHKALEDEDEGRVLWPERFPLPHLLGMREADPVSFEKRMQNVAIEESQLTFKREKLDLCRDFHQGWGQFTPKMTEGGFTTVIDSFDPTSGQTGRSKWCGFAAVAFNLKQQHPRDYYVLELSHFRALFEDQVRFIIKKHEQYNAYATIMEINGAHQYLAQSETLREWRQRGTSHNAHRIWPHYTDKVNKPDPLVGIPNVAEIAHAGRLHLPYGDEEARKSIGYFINEEAGKHPLSPTTDMLMALWFAIYNIDKVFGRAQRVVRREGNLPPWAQGYGMGRFGHALGPRTVVRP